MRFVRWEQGWGIHDLGTGLVQPILGTPWIDAATAPAPPVPLSSLRLLAPCTPSKIVAVGRNYRAHAAELGNSVPAEPLLFLKPPSAIVGPGDAIELPPQSARVEHEAELGVVIGRRLRDAGPEEALAAVFGVTCVNDVTARDLQRADVQFTRGKGFDTFCPVGPALVECPDPSDLAVVARVNGVVRQSGRTRDMIFPVATLLAFISGVMTLEPGDLVSTGTPEGVGPLVVGDVVEVEVEGVGALSNPVRARPSGR
jgi:2-keto-4-pentenoate hydratase/2-oxohepta-3-ene-1,7-dioic acid hydratase in catechol pathway